MTHQELQAIIRSMIEENAMAPDFTLPGADGDLVTLSSFRGKSVILYFYPQDDTPGCTKEACSLRDGVPALSEKGAVVIGVSPDPADRHQKFREKYGLPFTLLSDPEKTVMGSWGAWGEKMLYGKKVIGVIRQTYIIGPDGRVKKHIRKVVTADAANQVLKFL